MRNFIPQCFGFADSKHKVSSAKQQPSTLIEELCHRFSLSQLRKATANFHDSKIIGRGSVGTVYKGRVLVNGKAKEVAIKRFTGGVFSDYDEEKQFRNEIVLLCQLQHPNLVSLVGFCYDKNEMIIVYEYMSNGSLSDQLHRTHNYRFAPPLSWKKRLEICIGAARGLHYLRTGAKYAIFHRNVKPSSILLDENWIPKITDFRLSLRGPSFKSRHPKPIETEVSGTVGYMDTGYAMSGKVTEKVDIFSFGMVLLVVACGEDPAGIQNMLENMIDVPVPVPDHWSDHESEIKNECSISFISYANSVNNSVQKGYADKILDPFLKGKIAPECWNLFIDIAERCMLEEPTERPHMGEVEVELELALQLQEEADAKLSPGCQHSLVCTTSISSQPQQPNNEGVATH